MGINLQILQLNQKIERLTAQRDYLVKIEEIKARQTEVIDPKSEENAK